METLKCGGEVTVARSLVQIFPRLLVGSRAVQEVQERLPVLGVGVGLDVVVALYLPKFGVGVRSRKHFGLLEGHHFVVRRMNDQERYPFH